MDFFPFKWFKELLPNMNDLPNYKIKQIVFFFSSEHKVWYSFTVSVSDTFEKDCMFYYYPLLM